MIYPTIANIIGPAVPTNDPLGLFRQVFLVVQNLTDQGVFSHLTLQRLHEASAGPSRSHGIMPAHEPFFAGIFSRRGQAAVSKELPNELNKALLHLLPPQPHA